MPEKSRWRRGFWSLIATQFQGAFNENGLKYFVIYLVLGMNLSKTNEDRKVLLVGALFSLPFIIFSMSGGYLADRFSKRSVTIWIKYFEITLMLLATAAFAWHSLNLALLCVFLASTQGALFGPSKYGLLPELLPEKLLSWGNGVLELGTFLAIIAGSVAGAFMADFFRTRQEIPGLIFFGCSMLGLATSYTITRVPAADVEKKFRANFLGDLWSQGRLIRRDRVLWLAVLGNTYFWFFGALLQFDIVFYGKYVLRTSDFHDGILQAGAAVGIGLGCLAAGYFSDGKIEYGLVPLGAMGMTGFAFALAARGLPFATVLVLLAAVGFAGGFFVVPVNALIQHRPDEANKGGVIATANLLSFVGIFAASGVYYVLTSFLHLGPAAIFFWAAIATLFAGAYLLYLLPDSLLRLLLWLATHTIYRIEVRGRENVPEKGGALLVPNHASFVDAALLIASTDRFVRFLMFKDIYEHPLIRPFAKILRVIPISPQQRPREMIHSLREATESLHNGDVVCIFPEGQMTRIGQMLPFRRGMERIMKGVEAPIIPVHIDGIWGSVFSFSRGHFFWKFPRRIPYPVSVTFGKPLPPTATSQEARQAVQDVGVEAFEHRKRYMKTLHRSILQTARRYPRRLAMADGRTPKVRSISAVAKAIFLARRLRSEWRGQEMTGILLPPSVGGALANLGAMLAGKIPVNLNYTASNESLESCARQCQLETVITSREFLERVHVKPPARAIFIEEAAANPSFGEKLIAAIAALFFPARIVEKIAGAVRAPQLDDTATIIFSSGSTGEPKGVVLMHYNIGANVEQLMQVFLLYKDERILGILPFFHSFGFTGTLCLPLIAGVGVVFHPNPLDSRTIGGLVSGYKITMLLATPTFLQTYTRRCAPEDFGSLRFVMAGAEKMPERIAQAFEDHFGIRPLEGYGCTECSPVVAVNTRDFRAANFRQVGAKRGSIGHPLPGMSAKILDPETKEPRGSDQSGLLFVRGPNVMNGYLNQPEKTAEVLQGGWYNTGDIATIDEDGFIRITDRLNRFSKIGGEMVPHIKIEEKLQELSGSAEQVFAVTSIPDEKKGERLFVLHTLPEEALLECLQHLAQCELPALWRPRADQFARIENLPYLGTGKLDLRRLREIALKLSSDA
ncbi:MAG TPA: acyl-[ACP]--phospholipid O-acyltransferase [Candidatus Acidoferrales bacterium]|nr:acyl-[ACP]--phospholipid O-acyltransferase [Candidatus Acidoferrales bacterium]